MNVLEYLKTGKENAVSRRELEMRMGLPDRTIRNMIEAARREGALIVNLGNGEGYYISEDLNDIRHQYKMNNSRAMSILVQQKHLRRRIKELEAKEDSGDAI